MCLVLKIRQKNGIQNISKKKNLITGSKISIQFREIKKNNFHSKIDI